jgi:hypothetical protein
MKRTVKKTIKKIYNAELWNDFNNEKPWTYTNRKLISLANSIFGEQY